ncbi:MAG: Holliday junction branch migration DNA helicase RuvB [Weeksellaceae bacterium]
MATLENHALRPQTLKEYVGQEKAIQTLTLFLDAVNKRGHATEHILFYGPPGIGKTTLSYIIAHELKGTLRVTSGAAISKGGDLAAILTNLKDKDVLFIDEIHRLPKAVEEMLYPVIEEYNLDIIIGKGPSARTVRLPVPKITIVGATTKLAMLSAPLRDRFGLLLRLDYYTDKELINIIKTSAARLEVKVTDDAAVEIAKRARRTPRIANRILKRARDMIQVQQRKEIDLPLLESLFTLLDIDELGLSDLDTQYLRVIAERFQNTPVGLETLASSLSEDKRTIEEFIEPYLLRLGFIRKTTKGRVVTPKAKKHLQIPLSKADTDQQALL